MVDEDAIPVASISPQKLCKMIRERQHHKRMETEAVDENSKRYHADKHIEARKAAQRIVKKSTYNELMRKQINHGVMDWNKTFGPGSPTLPLIITNMAHEATYGEIVQFHGKRDLDFDQCKAQVLCNVSYTGTDTGSKRGQPIFQGTVLDPKDLLKKLKEISSGHHILFYIHDIHDQPEWVIFENQKIVPANVTKYFVVPLLWGGIAKRYSESYIALDTDRHSNLVPDAGRDFSNLLLTSGLSQVKEDLDISLAAMGYGNIVLRVLAAHMRVRGGEDTFESIFMVAADNSKEFFTKESNPGYQVQKKKSLHEYIHLHDWRDTTKKNPGLDTKSICKNKVFVLWKKNDEAYDGNGDGFSIGTTNGDTSDALGNNGDYCHQTMHPDLIPYVECYEVISDEDDDNHVYQWDREAVQFYESKMDREVTIEKKDIVPVTTSTSRAKPDMPVEDHDIMMDESTRGGPYKPDYKYYHNERTLMNNRRRFDAHKFFGTLPPVPMIITNLAPPTRYGEKVEFHAHGQIKDREAYDAQILCNVKYSGKNAGSAIVNQPIFEGEVLNPKLFRKKLKEISNGKHILFYVHGFSEQPSWVIYDTMKRVKARCTKYHIVLVIWETPKGLLALQTSFNYKRSRHDFCPDAGRDFARIIDVLALTKPKRKADDIKMSLMAASQGNLLLRIMAANVKHSDAQVFENIFMVCADCTRQYFSREFNPGYDDVNSVVSESSSSSIFCRKDWTDETRNNPGHDTVGLVKKKVYVVWKQRDIALSVVGRQALSLNCANVDPNALGTHGDYSESTIHPDLAPRVEFYEILINNNKRDTSHTYFWDEEAIEFYELKA